MIDSLVFRFAVALFIGALIGLQREHASEGLEQRRERVFAGVRTFILLALAGTLSAFLADILETPWAFIVLITPVGLLIVAAYIVTSRQGDVGMTTEVAAVITVLTGGLCFWGELELAVALGVVTTALLSFKLELRGFAARLTDEDIVATLKFAIITAIILPILPNQSFFEPPFDVLNPYKIWLMVVLISGISFLGYVLIKFVGPRQGIGLTGFLGGLVSSTAVTLTMAQRSQKEPRLNKSFAFAVIIAWVVMFGRVLVEVLVTNRPLLQVVWLPITVTGVVGLGFGVYLFATGNDAGKSTVKVSNPFDLGPAITFGLLYGLILLIARAAQFYFGDTGIFISSILSGLADVDAITLSMAELSKSGAVSTSTASKAITLAVLSNTTVKGAIVLTTGSPALRKVIWPGFALIFTVGLLLTLLL